MTGFEETSKNSDTDSDEEDDVLDNLPALLEKNRGRPRISVSGESFSEKKNSDFKPPFVEKTKEAKERLSNRLGQAFMFSSLEDNEKEIVVDAMREHSYK